MFTKAMYAPDLKHNLISISCMDKAGYSIIFRHGNAAFHDLDNALVMCSEGFGGVYLLDLHMPSTLIPTANVAWYSNLSQKALVMCRAWLGSKAQLKLSLIRLRLAPKVG
jgi:hypothetical protein